MQLMNITNDKMCKKFNLNLSNSIMHTIFVMILQHCPYMQQLYEGCSEGNAPLFFSRKLFIQNV
jgi:hypothetical protein